MSVTFYPGMYVEDERFGTVLSFIDDLDNELDVNMHNANGARVLEAMGFEVDTDEGMVGDAPAADFLGRLLLALAMPPVDDGMPAYQTNVGEPGAKHWEAQRRPGALHEHLLALHMMAEICQENNWLVVWA